VTFPWLRAGSRERLQSRGAARASRVFRQRISCSCLLGVLLFLTLTDARGGWTATERERSVGKNAAVTRHAIDLQSETGATAQLQLAVFDSTRATIRVIDDPSVSASLAEAMRRDNCLAGVNGGYFDPEYAPVGLLISDGQVIAPLRKARLLSGVITVVNGRVRIVRPAEFSMKSKPTAARQCGPFLIDRGKPIAGLNETRPARRTFFATISDNRAAIGYCSHVTLAQLAEIIAALDLKIQRALNLDGGSSSGFWFAGENGVFSIREQKTVRDYIAIVPK